MRGRTYYGIFIGLLLAGCAAPPPGPQQRGGPPRPDGPPPPPAAGLFVSPMGEPFRGQAPDTAWFAGADADRDGRLTVAEMRTDADRFFALLDVNGDGEIDPAEIDRYETGILPEVRTAGPGRGGGSARGGRAGPPPGGGPDGPPPGGPDAAGAPVGRQGAARFGWLDLPEPVIAADANFNRGISRAEFADAAGRRFLLLDADRDGALTAAELLHRSPPPGGRHHHGRPPPRD